VDEPLNPLFRLNVILEARLIGRQYANDFPNTRRKGRAAWADTIQKNLHGSRVIWPNYAHMIANLETTLRHVAAYSLASRDVVENRV
jgi:hypothetical protein